MSEEKKTTRPVTVKRYIFTSARIDFVPITVEVPANLSYGEAYDYALENIDEYDWEEDRTITYEDKNGEVEYEVEDPECPANPEDEDEDAEEAADEDGDVEGGDEDPE